jgi:hypothetical protein
LAVGVLAGFGLHFSPAALRAEPWVIVLVGTTGFGVLLAALRRKPVPSIGESGRSRRLHISRASALAAVLALALAGVAFGLARTPLPAKDARGYTALWLLPGKKSASMQVGVESAELRRMSYRLEVRRGPRVIASAPLTLEPGERWSAVIEVDSIPRSRRSFVALLYRAHESDALPAYRRAALVLPGSTAPPTTLLWLLPVNTGVLRVGMINAAAETRRYRIELYAGRKRERLWSIKLGPGREWNAPIDISSIPEERRSFEALVYRANERAPKPALRRSIFVLPDSTAPLAVHRSIGGMGP